MARTQEERRADTRGRLLAAAADLFARKGFHAVSAEAVAGAADRTTGALYDHFGGKEGLLLALLEVWKEQTVADLLAELDDRTDLDTRLGALWQSVTTPDDERGDSWLLLEMELWLHGARDPAVGALLADRFVDARRRLAAGLSDWAGAVDLTLPAPAEQVAVQVMGLLLGAALQQRLAPEAVADATVVGGLRRLLDLPPPAS